MENQNHPQPRDNRDGSQDSQAQAQGTLNVAQPAQPAPVTQLNPPGERKDAPPANQETGSQGDTQETGIPTPTLRIGSAECSPEFAEALQNYDPTAEGPQPVELARFPYPPEFHKNGRF